ncbi:antitoxin [Candidatus Beckwithbacteria bacterium CG22_combo_CG10-13_8_21_14_all_01_47_9]|uniref:Antitoxin n=5 Tax=Candidatus Beckwithiibacteriota TaxID=1752726 RepID=A0A2H0E0S1_9BACT|nr:MAG: hypothetical protein AUJ59_03100 [Candidatus Beckwithbacteria bacterium CG1_02_47_37]PIP52548.1 MAG: antitoxin [Candidatus Beckwithbacteria bacterium CG23_combo_of_CG06-09_8_20_14_all_47_9]PIP87549.1 MAG: antitoxin [Candidatus Beckwithbacteria bacterium CG22_combo_CG10-13_8_21_14_all_01_47_9]PJA21503.1 MAG: antitoxin [Candidatus Beckwithbacteria bacterium CG_4_10_14_0_2_um_filter_47_25]PJC65977.1 MAG: antitoxin [Candidatus Beckwithbacteria bacterium CG_4_9_14_0_2_um_filter_47_11]
MKRVIDIPISGPVVSSPDILSGTPVIKGSRIPAALVLELMRRGYSLQLIRTEYPSLSTRKLNDFLALISRSMDVRQPAV